MKFIDIAKLAQEYAVDRTAVRRCAEAHGVSIQIVYRRMRQAGVPIRHGGDATRGTQAGPKNPNWKDGITRRTSGYILERRNGKQQFQHRLVAESVLGRPLRPGECVHHKNGIKSDNRPENLEVLSSHAEHMKRHSDPLTMSERGRLGCIKRWKPALKARAQDEEVEHEGS